jgi:predicted lysophospholipase L1 biosynthesis ABC-type transport system permease subunit
MGDMTMALILKYMVKDFMKRKSMVVICFLFFVFVSFLHFFVHFSVDLNLQRINGDILQNISFSNEQEKYYTALQNNQVLIRNITWSFLVIISVILFLFMRNQMQRNQTVTGQLLAMGYERNTIIGSYVLLTACLSLLGALCGLILGYFASDILIEANRKTYLVTGILKGIRPVTLISGMVFIPAIFSFITSLSVIDIDKKDVALLLKPADGKSFPGPMERLIQCLPISDKSKFKLTLKNISAILFLLIAVVTFNIMCVLSVSLIFSGNKIMQSQQINRQYRYDLEYDHILLEGEKESGEDIYYLTCGASVKLAGNMLKYQIVGVDRLSRLFQLTDKKGNPIDIGQGLVLNPELEENYGIKVGDTLSVFVEDKRYDFPVTAIAENAELKTIYLSKQQVAALMNQSSLAYNGILTNQYQAASIADTLDNKISEIERSLTSNRASAVLNQMIGIITGCLLIFLALLIGLNNNIKSILIFDLLGYRIREIKQMLLDPYIIVINLLFLLTMPVCIYAAKSIQIMTSIQTNDYMPFQINMTTFVYMVVILNLLCVVVKALFVKKIRKIINEEKQAEFLYEW